MARECHRDRDGPPAAARAGRAILRAVRVLNPTPASRLTDAKGRPYFLWDMELTLDGFRALLRDGDDTTKAWLIGKLMRQAKPDDVFQFVTLDEIRTRFASIERHLGRSGPMWRWLLDVWNEEPPCDRV